MSPTSIDRRRPVWRKGAYCASPSWDMGRKSVESGIADYSGWPQAVASTQTSILLGPR